MSTANDLTRRLIADFFAARLEARRSGADAPRTSHQDADPIRVPNAEQDPSRPEDLGDRGSAEDSEVN